MMERDEWIEKVVGREACGGGGEGGGGEKDTRSGQEDDQTRK